MLKPGGALHVTCSTPPVFTPGAVPRYVEMAVADPAEFFSTEPRNGGPFPQNKKRSKNPQHPQHKVSGAGGARGAGGQHHLNHSVSWESSRKPVSLEPLEQVLVKLASGVGPDQIDGDGGATAGADSSAWFDCVS